MPRTSRLAKQCGLPFAAVVCPFTGVGVGEADVPVVESHDGPPLACASCRAVVTSHAVFGRDGKTFTCAFCRQVGRVPLLQQCAVDASGRRLDVDSNAAFRVGSVDFDLGTVSTSSSSPSSPSAGRDDVTGTPLGFPYVFLIDVSAQAVENGALRAALRAVTAFLSDVASDDNVRVGIVAFDSTLHFFVADPVRPC